MKLLPLYHVNNTYTYFRQAVTYVRRDEDYYHFKMLSGANLLIDTSHIHLIYGKTI